MVRCGLEAPDGLAAGLEESRAPDLPVQVPRPTRAGPSGPARTRVAMGAPARPALPQRVSLGRQADEEAAPVVEARVRGGRSPRPAPPRLPAHGRPQPHPGWRAAGHRHEDHRAQDGFDLPSIPDRGRGAPRPGGRSGGGVAWTREVLDETRNDVVVERTSSAGQPSTRLDSESKMPLRVDTFWAQFGHSTRCDAVIFDEGAVGAFWGTVWAQHAMR